MTFKATKAANTNALSVTASPMQTPTGEFVFISLDISKVPTETINSRIAAYAQGEAKMQPSNRATNTKPEIERVNNSFMAIKM